MVLLPVTRKHCQVKPVANLGVKTRLAGLSEGRLPSFKPMSPGGDLKKQSTYHHPNSFFPLASRKLETNLAHSFPCHTTFFLTP